MDSLQTNYFDLFFKKRITEYKKIDEIKSWEHGTAKARYGSIDEFYKEFLNVDLESLNKIKKHFFNYKEIFDKYYNNEREELFENPEKLEKWFTDQNNKCGYCDITQSELSKIVKNRGGNLTLNKKSKRSKGVLEIEKMDPSKGYIFDNCILACPLCNNAKSNLISSDDWLEFFKPAMKKYYKMLLIS